MNVAQLGIKLEIEIMNEMRAFLKELLLTLWSGTLKAIKLECAITPPILL